MNYAALVLAAGSARRFGSDKLSASFHDAPLYTHAVRAAQAAPVSRVILVAHRDLAPWPWTDAPPVTIAPITSTALSESLRAGVAAAGSVDGLFVFLGDMPLVPHAMATTLAERIGDAYAAVPRHAGKPGHPVLLSRRALADVAALTGDAGAGKLLRSCEDVMFLDTADPAVLADVDRPADLMRLAQVRT